MGNNKIEQRLGNVFTTSAWIAPTAKMRKATSINSTTQVPQPSHSAHCTSIEQIYSSPRADYRRVALPQLDCFETLGLFHSIPFAQVYSTPFVLLHGTFLSRISAANSTRMTIAWWRRRCRAECKGLSQVLCPSTHSSKCRRMWKIISDFLRNPIKQNKQKHLMVIPEICCNDNCILGWQLTLGLQQYIKRLSQHMDK